MSPPTSILGRVALCTLASLSLVAFGCSDDAGGSGSSQTTTTPTDDASMADVTVDTGSSTDTAAATDSAPTGGTDGSATSDVAKSDDATTAGDDAAANTKKPCTANKDCPTHACNLKTKLCVDACKSAKDVEESCDGVDNTCDGTTDEAICDDGNACTVDTCYPASGKCKSVDGNNGQPCDDKQPCTIKDVCSAGTCAGDKKVCNDGDPCTFDGCVKKTGKCGAVPGHEGADCTDKNACTVKDACEKGACKGQPKPCADNDPCTADGCAVGICTHVPAPVAPTITCDDLNPCTLSDTCDAAGKCAGKLRSCDDANPCTNDSCDPTTGKCVFKAIPASAVAPCNDGDLCTLTDTCDGFGACSGKGAKKCDDGNACTTDSCDGKLGCVAKPATTYVPCGGGKVCDSGACVSAASIGLCGADGSKLCARLATGWKHTCATWGDGMVRCWGANSLGQLGGGHLVSLASPVTPVHGIGPGTSGGKILTIAASLNATCALTAAGKVFCWGSNAHGEIGIGKQASAYGLDPPAEKAIRAVKTAGVYVDIAAAGMTFCALRNDRTVMCWGSGERGTLGDGKQGAGHVALVPQLVANLADVVSLAGGGEHICARTANKKVHCWGGNAFGQLGNSLHAGTYTGGAKNALNPKPVTAGIADAVGLSASAVNTCARRPDGSHACWGRNDTGQVGNYKTIKSYSGAPVEASPVIGNAVKDARQIVGHVRHRCMIRADRSVACWGAENYGGLGNGSAGKSGVTETPQPVKLPGAVSEIAAGGSFPASAGENDGHTCARLGDGRVFCWGSGKSGQLGDGNKTDRPAPVAVAAELCKGVTNTECNDGDICTLDKCVTGFCHHVAGPSGPCDDGSKCTSNDRCSGGKCVGKLKACNDGNACSVDSCDPKSGLCQSAPAADGTACSVAGKQKVCLKGTCSDPKAAGFCGLDGSKPCRKLAGGAAFNCVLFDDSATGNNKAGTVTCWGENNGAQFGMGIAASKLGPTKSFTGITDGLSIRAGFSYACVLRKNGRVVCAGRNDFGQIGNGKHTPNYPKGKNYESKPVDVGLANVVDLAAGGFTAYTVTSDGKLWAWGDQRWGQAGTGTANKVETKAQPVTKVGKVLSVSAGYGHACALEATGQVYCWGYNAYGQVGNGKVGKHYGGATKAREGTPVAIANLNDAVAVWAGGFFSCAKRKSGEIRCWGLNNYGQIGTGSTGGDNGTYQSKPVVAKHLTGATIIAGQLWHACGIINGKMACWGVGFHGALGNGFSGSLKIFEKPVVPIASGTWRDVSGGGASLTLGGSTSHSCAVNDTGQVWCWGRNDIGQLGPNVSHSNKPIKVL